MDHDQARNFGDSDAEKPVVEIDIKNAYDASEYVSLESYVQKLPGTVGVNLDRTRGVAHVSYNPAVTTPEKLWGALRRCGYECDCYVRVESKSQSGHPQVGTQAGAAHAAHTAVGGVEAEPHRDHAAMGHGEHEGHGAGMVRDFLRRLVVSTILSLPLIIFSPVGAEFGLPSIPPFGLSMGLLGFLLATPIV
jgi:Cu2+-exporting ATPase